jgi:Mn2+/Fe2+ NRAMP family transporter
MFGSLLLITMSLWVHSAVMQITHDLMVPRLPAQGQPSDVIPLIRAIVGTTVAPWRLFFQQSCVIDKRIMPRFIRYERGDVCGSASCS